MGTKVITHGKIIIIIIIIIIIKIFIIKKKRNTSKNKMSGLTISYIYLSIMYIQD